MKKALRNLPTPAEIALKPKNLSFNDAIPHLAFNEREVMIADEVVVGKNEFEGEQLKTLPPRFYIRRKSCICKHCKLHKDFPGFDIVLDQDHPDNFIKKRKNMIKKAMRQAGKTSLFVSKLKSMATSLGAKKESEGDKKKRTLKRAVSDVFIKNLRAKLAVERLSNPDYKGKEI